MPTRLTASLLAIIAGSGTAIISAQAAAPRELLLYSFKSVYTGEQPYEGLTLGPDGAFYGTAALGGYPTIEGGNTGVIFRLAPPAPGHTAWTETLLHRFRDTTDGKNPYYEVVFDEAGNFYGTTGGGGNQNYGTVFKMSPTDSTHLHWTFSVISSSGAGRLVINNTGILYGVAKGGLFSLTQPAGSSTTWARKVVYPLSTSSPQLNGEIAIDGAGAIYATSQEGGSSKTSQSGAVWKFTPSSSAHPQWSRSVLFSFLNGNTGYQPESGVTIGQDGSLFGTTYFGLNGYGGVYKLTPPPAGTTKWTETVIYSFNDGTDGELPIGGLTTDPAGNLYGTTSEGGTTFNGQSAYGVAFKLSPPSSGQTAWDLTPLHGFGATGSDFNPTSDAIMPTSTMLFASGALYGMTTRGGVNNRNGGAIFKIVP